VEKTLLVLGASFGQIGTIKKAKNLGYRVITVDYIKDNPGHQIADTCYNNIDTTNRTEVLAIAKKEKIDGIISPESDVAMPTLAYISEEMNLAGIPFEATKVLCSKLNLRKFQKEHSINYPEYEEIFENSKKEIRSPKIIKPDVSSAGIGIHIIKNVQDMHLYAYEAFSHSLNKKALLEEYIDGFQGTCEGVFFNGKVQLHLFLDRQTISPPFVSTTGHKVPTRLPGDMQLELLKTIECIFKILEIKHYVFDCDFVVKDNAVYILEITARLGGNSISKLMKTASGFDNIEYNIRLACDDNPEIGPTSEIKPAAIVILGSEREGYFDYDEKSYAELINAEWVKEIVLNLQKGSKVVPFKNGRLRIGEALITGSSRADIDEKFENIKSFITIK